MREIGFWGRFVLAILATWRVTHALVHEDGPADIFVHVRKRLGASLFGRLMDCFQCASLWGQATFTMFVSREPVEWVVGWFAVSGATCLLERIGATRVEQLPLFPEGESDHGMLRSETSRTREDDAEIHAEFDRRN